MFFFFFSLPFNKIIFFVTPVVTPARTASNVGSVVECSPATRAARVRFPDVACTQLFPFIRWPSQTLETCVLFQGREGGRGAPVSLATSRRVNENKIVSGDAGYRSPYLSHAKRALYHLSYIPCVGKWMHLNCFDS